MKIPPFEKSCASNPELVKIWSTENALNPEQVYLKSNKNIKWKCFTCNHIYKKIPYKMYRDNNCTYCSNRILCENIECNICFNKSCASIKNVNKIWCKENKLNPNQVFLRSTIIINWNCLKCNHIYDQSPDKKYVSSNCPYCSNRILCDNEKCKYCFTKSCASIKDINIVWNKENKQLPRELFLYSKSEIKWNCLYCNHMTIATPGDKKIKYGISKCTYCDGKKLCNNEKCNDCFKKSCASNNELVKIWNDKNKINPREVFLHSNIVKINWKCLKCNNNYNQTPNSKNQGSGCPKCKHKTEKKVITFLNSKNINIESQFKLNDDTKRYDILCNEFNIIIEIDGRQHFKEVKLFKNTAKENQENDKNKMIKAMEQGYSFIRIFQEDIWNDKIDWQNLILDNLKIRNKPTVLYFSSIEFLYDNHQLI